MDASPEWGLLRLRRGNDPEPTKPTAQERDDFIRRVLPDLATDRRRVHLSGDVEVFDPDQPWVWFIPSVLANEIWPTTPAATTFGGLMPGIAYYQLRTQGAPPARSNDASGS
jgi:hypothetical protein